MFSSELSLELYLLLQSSNFAVAYDEDFEDESRPIGYIADWHPFSADDVYTFTKTTGEGANGMDKPMKDFTLADETGNASISTGG